MDNIKALLLKRIDTLANFMEKKDLQKTISNGFLRPNLTKNMPEITLAD